MEHARSSVRKWLRRAGFVALAVGGVYLLLILYVLASDPLGLSGSDDGHFPNALHWSVPEAWRETTFVGYEDATAEALDRSRQGRDFDERLRFVNAATPSTGNLVVSVNPIDRFTWGATAMASNDRCYALLVALDRDHPQHGTTYYARFPKGTPCEANRAIRESVTLTDPPD